MKFLASIEFWTLVAAVAAVLVAYHVAFRQGVFAKSALFTSFAAPAEEGLPNVPAQVVLIAVPRSSREHLVAALPLVVQNRGSVAIRNLWINLEYARSLGVSGNSHVVAAIGKIQWPDSTRGENSSDDRVRINHELPVLRPEETMVLAEPIVFRTRELLSDPSTSYKAFPVFLQTIGENVRRKKGYVQVAFVRADNIEELQEQFGTVVQNIVHENGSLIASLLSVMVSRMFRTLISRTQCLLVVPRVREMTDSVAVDEMLFGNSGTGYQTAELGVYIKELPTGKPLSWREAKEIRRSKRDLFG